MRPLYRWTPKMATANRAARQLAGGYGTSGWRPRLDCGSAPQQMLSPAHQQTLEQANRQEQEQREPGRHEDRREDEVGAEGVLRQQHVDAQALARAGPFAEDGADNRVGDPDAQAGEEIG